MLLWATKKKSKSKKIYYHAYVNKIIEISNKIANELNNGTTDEDVPYASFLSVFEKRR
jgi:hypothetical protein